MKTKFPKTMAGRALFASGLLLLSWFLSVYGRDLINGGRQILQIKSQKNRVTKTLNEEDEGCDRSINGLLSRKKASALTSPVMITVHRNGEAESCGSTPISVRLMDAALQSFKGKACPPDGRDLDKYTTETLLTEFVNQQLVSGSCQSTDKVKNKALDGFLGFCDGGRELTPPQPDSEHLIPVPSGSLPCRFFTREGVRVSSLEQLATLVKNSTKVVSAENCTAEEAGVSSSGEVGTCQSTGPKLDLYAVPAGRVFMFAPQFVGEIFQLPHVRDKSGNPLSLEVLSLRPRVFDIHNFFSQEEAQSLVDKTLRERSETHKLQRSTTGTTGASVFNKRTSENGWDTHGKVAQVVKRRCTSTLGFDEYYESHTDGLQIVRYNLTTAYTSHMDYLDDAPGEAYDYNSEGRGGNRFATILLYMSDLDKGAGGETVFSRTPTAPGDPSKKEMIRDLRANGEIDQLKPGSWEEDMTAVCRTRFSVRPSKSRAVLFYSQFPNGTLDPLSFHGGCPVLNGTKWMANLWVWNAARNSFDHAPYKLGQESKVTASGTYTPIKALFFNSGQDPAYAGARLYWHDTYFGELASGESVRVTTYVSHVWNVKNPSGETLKSWTIDKVPSEDLHFTV